MTKLFPVIDLEATGQNIVRLRKARNLSVRDLQNWFGFEEPQAIYKWQKGKSLPTVDNLYALGALLDVPLEEILVPRNPQVNRINNGAVSKSMRQPLNYILICWERPVHRSQMLFSDGLRNDTQVIPYIFVLTHSLLFCPAVLNTTGLCAHVPIFSVHTFGLPDLPKQKTETLQCSRNQTPKVIFYQNIISREMYVCQIGWRLL